MDFMADFSSHVLMKSLEFSIEDGQRNCCSRKISGTLLRRLPSFCNIGSNEISAIQLLEEYCENSLFTVKDCIEDSFTTAVKL